MVWMLLRWLSACTVSCVAGDDRSQLLPVLSFGMMGNKHKRPKLDSVILKMSTVLGLNRRTRTLYLVFAKVEVMLALEQTRPDRTEPPENDRRYYSIFDIIY